MAKRLSRTRVTKDKCRGEYNTPNSLLSLELVDKAIGSRIHIIMKNDKEVVCTLLGFDDFINIVLDDVVDYESTSEWSRGQPALKSASYQGQVKGSILCTDYSKFGNLGKATEFLS